MPGGEQEGGSIRSLASYFKGVQLQNTEGVSNFDSAAHDLFGVLYFSIWDMKGKDFRADGDIHI